MCLKIKTEKSFKCLKIAKFFFLFINFRFFLLFLRNFFIFFGYFPKYFYFLLSFHFLAMARRVRLGIGIVGRLGWGGRRRWRRLAAGSFLVLFTRLLVMLFSFALRLLRNKQKLFIFSLFNSLLSSLSHTCFQILIFWKCGISQICNGVGKLFSTILCVFLNMLGERRDIWMGNILLIWGIWNFHGILNFQRFFIQSSRKLNLTSEFSLILQ